MQPQDFGVIATRALNGDVVFVQRQLTCARDPARPAHAWMGLEPGHGILQLQHKTGRARRVVFGDEPGDFIDGAKRRVGPLYVHGSSAEFGEHRFDLPVGGEFPRVGFRDALVNVANLPGFTLHIVGQRIDGQKALAPCGRLGQLLNLVSQRLGQAHGDSSGGHGVTLLCMCIALLYPLHGNEG